MGRPRILINCPGGWSHGLDSPERGEGRWAQNLARCLSKTGRWSVFACSGGDATWGRGDRYDVTLLSERAARDQQPYDFYFDAAWWKGKPPAAKATGGYFHVHFGFDRHLCEPLPSRHYLVYVLKKSQPSYFQPECGNADRTFYLPAPFAAAMVPPDPSRRKIIHTMRGLEQRMTRFDVVHEAVDILRQRGLEIPFTWISAMGQETPRHEQDRVLSRNADWGIPYNELRTELAQSGLNIALDGWASLLDCTALGVPSLAWTGGIDSTAIEVAAKYDLVLDHQTATAQRISGVIAALFSDSALYSNYVNDLQAAFADHIEPVTVRLFDEMVEKVLR